MTKFQGEEVTDSLPQEAAAGSNEVVPQPHSPQIRPARRFSCSSHSFQPFHQLCCPFSGCTQGPSHPSQMVCPELHSVRNDTATKLTKVGQSPPLTNWFCYVRCTPGWGFPCRNARAQKDVTASCSFSYSHDHLEAFQAPRVKPADSKTQQINKTLLKILPKFLWRFQHTNWPLQLFWVRWLYNFQTPR